MSRSEPTRGPALQKGAKLGMWRASARGCPRLRLRARFWAGDVSRPLARYSCDVSPCREEETPPCYRDAVSAGTVSGLPGSRTPPRPLGHHSRHGQHKHRSRSGLRERPGARSEPPPVVNTSSTSRMRRLSTRAPWRVAYAPRSEVHRSVLERTNGAGRGFVRTRRLASETQSQLLRQRIWRFVLAGYSGARAAGRSVTERARADRRDTLRRTSEPTRPTAPQTIRPTP